MAGLLSSALVWLAVGELRWRVEEAIFGPYASGLDRDMLEACIATVMFLLLAIGCRAGARMYRRGGGGWAPETLSALLAINGVSCLAAMVELVGMSVSVANRGWAYWLVGIYREAPWMAANLAMFVAVSSSLWRPVLRRRSSKLGLNVVVPMTALVTLTGAVIGAPWAFVSLWYWVSGATRLYGTGWNSSPLWMAGFAPIGGLVVATLLSPGPRKPGAYAP